MELDRDEDTLLDGYVIDATPLPFEKAISIICGHDVVQALDDEAAVNFRCFLRALFDTEVVPHMKDPKQS
jgi:hypothetical protein